METPISESKKYVVQKVRANSDDLDLRAVRYNIIDKSPTQNETTHDSFSLSFAFKGYFSVSSYVTVRVPDREGLGARVG